MWLAKLNECVTKWLFNKKWTCTACGKEIFEDEYFCQDCLKALPYISGSYCAHCGRQTLSAETYCTTCKNTLTALDMGRSVFRYELPVSDLIKKLKRYEYRYLAEIFAEYLAQLYFKNFINADFMVFVPMTRKAEKRRGFNQSKLLAVKLSEITGIPVMSVFEKVKETKSQKSLTRNQRLTNLDGAFNVINKSAVENKTIVIIDDVTTTGTTAQVLAEKLKKYKASKVVLLTVASVPPVDGY